ncbi:MAG: glycosyltransferase family 4 protein [Acidobacteriia bacterium]|nr:glycosyltransferase family 4 protein [Terriglobia bacterium]
MRVIEVSDRAGFGGIERVADDLTTGLQSRGHSVLRLSLLKAERQGAVRSIGLRGLSGLRPVLITARALETLCREHQIDVVHSHSAVVDRSMALRSVTGVRHVRTVHSFDDGYMGYSRLKSWRAAWEGRAVLRASYVVYVARHVADDCMSNGGRIGRFRTIIRNAIPDCGVSITNQRKDIDVLQVGNFYAVKNQKETIAALAHLRDRGFKANVTFVGDGVTRSEVQRYAEQLGLHESASFIGHADARPLYRRAHVVAATSRYEGCPLNLLEAHVSGCLVVASDIPGHVEVAAHLPTVALYTMGNCQALAFALESRLMVSRDLKERHATEIPRQYSYSAFLEAYERVLLGDETATV